VCEYTGCSFYCSQLCLRCDFTAEQKVLMFYVLISVKLFSKVILLTVRLHPKYHALEEQISLEITMRLAGNVNKTL